ncbi:HAD family hydrolase [Oscillatoria sp. CS-180]|uniref:HAD family hydrolase n=1 Tax=Oscillatoria sp. CS-180 TaxID=3021720 RepID=UPI002331480B|nr:HAD family hydrolase [Oscillatoria sp. CS-180]MDB9528005.1 HAD family hydrolase [Oscillatoria sp. CS-180]
MTTLEAIIFDVDGTLAETERDGHRVAFNQTFQAAGLNWHWSTALYGDLLQVAGGKERIRYFIEHYSPHVPEIHNWTEFIADLHRTKTERYTALLKTGNIQLRPGVERLISEARRAGLCLAIATTSRLENALTLLETALDPEAANWFAVIAAGDIVPHKKPAPDIYHYVLDKTALSSSHCIVIEDTEHGLAAATGAGLKTVVTINGYTVQQNFSKASLVLNHLGEPTHPCQVLQGMSMNQAYFSVAIAQQLLTL